MKKLLGFRSGVPWKKIVAVLYYMFCITVLIVGLSTPPLVACGTWDSAVVKISTCIIFLWLISPAIVLSDTALRDSLPLFREHVSVKSLVGLMIVFVLFTYMFRLTESWHTEDYKERFQTYIEVSYHAFIEAGENSGSLSGY